MEAAEYVLARLKIDKIDIAIVEGSGLLDISSSIMPDQIVIDMHDIPHCPIPTALGHKQDLLYGVI